MNESFNAVRAIVDARIAEREARRRRSAEAFECRRASLELVSPPDPRDGACMCLSAPALGGVRKAASCRRLPEDLKVPSPEPRPPNLNAANLSFAARLIIAVRDRFGNDAPKVYTAAKVSRQAYSQIISDETRPVSKRTAIRFAFALRSTPEEAKRLLKSAGYAFSNSQTEDFILQACLEVNPPIWDLDTVNKLLQEYRVDFQY